MKGVTSFCSIVTVLSWTFSVAAQWTLDLPSVCGSSEEFGRDLRQLIGDEAERELQLQGAVTQLESGSFSLRLATPEWSRQIEDPDCRALLKAGAVIVAAAIERSRGRGEPDPDLDSGTLPPDPPKPRLESPNPTEVPPSDEPLDAPPRSGDSTRSAPGRDRARTRRAGRTGSGVEGFVRAGGGVEFGLAPGPRGVFDLGGGTRFGSWGADLEARIVPPTSSYPLGDVGLRQWGLGARLAASWDPSELFHVLLGASVMRLRGTGLGVDQEAGGTLWLPSVEAEAQLRPLRFGRWGLEAALRGRVSLTRPRFEVDPDLVVYQLPRWGGALLFRGFFFL